MTARMLDERNDAGDGINRHSHLRTQTTGRRPADRRHWVAVDFWARISISEGQFAPGRAQMPLHESGRHAEVDMCAHPAFEPMPDAEFELDCLE
jgi:hypothetical protein